MRRNTVRGTLAAAALLSLAVAGCGDPPQQAGADEVIIAFPSDVDTVDPHQFRSVAAYGVVGNIYGTLLQEEYAAPAEGVLEYTGRSVPYLAESANWNDTKTVLTLKLRPDLKFADGSAVAAEDVVYSLQRALSDVGYVSAVGAWFNVKDPAKDIVAVDRSTVELRVTHYSALIEMFLTFQIFAVLDKSTAEAKAATDDSWSAKFFAKDATESGPYVVDSLAEGQTTLSKNPNFTATDLSDAPDKVVVKNMPDQQQAFLALQNGAVDMVYGLTPDIAQAVEKDANLKLYDLPYSDIVYLGMNNKDPVLKDVRVRQAISYLMPYDALRTEVMKGYAGAAYGAVPYPMRDSLDEKGDRVAYPTDVEKAKQLLSEAGVAPGELSLTLSVPATELSLRQSAVFIQSALQQGGIAVKLNEMNDAEFNSDLGKMQLYIDSWYSWGQDSVYQLFFLLKTGLFTNYTNFSNADVDRLIEQAMATSDTAERSRLAKQAQQIVIDQAPWAFLFTRNMLVGAQAGVSGITHSNDANLRFDRLRVAAE
ncbi:ABC transporter substrate-binding protein [Micromonospora sp. WMMD1102]|uniref:ABC transporter substrate-binding protein n=1 Tax=Micromonospora sp. WMMD1102 TaxID=3016105 RepID=UPI0024156D14|nr:ABC transporter substrate-binding protein [Micromonospora sp. WMMD1102]MDG4788065.1 ABC transporter substrate-binding protein [Micromonospora sp. WMMD1102]